MRAIILIMDSFGIGAAPDAERFNCVGTNTLGHIAEHCAQGLADNGRSGPLRIPNLEQLGIGLAAQLASGVVPATLSSKPQLIGAYAAAREVSAGMDTPSGHWELAGVPVRFEWGYFPNRDHSFPQELLDNLIHRAKLPGCLGNCHASGTTIIEQFGEEHMKTGKPIFYTSADSVFQIACHEETFGLQRLYKLCEIAHSEVNRFNICRVIARPFLGNSAEDFKRTGNRRDIAVPPPADTVLKKLANAGGNVVSIGKIADIFAKVGITQSIKATGLDRLWDATLQATCEARDRSIVMTNFVDFDSSYGHRRDVAGYATALEYFDNRLVEMYPLLGRDDVLILAADHGCDPTWSGSDHTREYVPVLVYGKRIEPRSFGVLDTFSDVGQSLAHWFGLAPFVDGRSFLPMLG